MHNVWRAWGYASLLLQARVDLKGASRTSQVVEGTIHQALVALIFEHQKPQLQSNQTGLLDIDGSHKAQEAVRV
jgi:hypothetical protein